MLLATGHALYRYIYSVIILILILVIAEQQSHLAYRIPGLLRSHSRSQAGPQPEVQPVCKDAVRRTLTVPFPMGVDPQSMRMLWQEIETLFKTTRPVPDTLERPPRPEDGADPVISEMREQVEISEDDGKQTREIHANLLTSLPKFPEGLYTGGKGVVTLGGGRYSEFAATSLGVLRELGSKLPVEVWVVDEAEEMQGWCVELAIEGMACRRLSDYIDTKSFKSAYQYKIFTMLFSAIEEVIFIDADSIPLRDPQEVFESEAYKTTGAILWPDYWESIASPHLPYLVGVSEDWTDHRWYETGTIESGQIMWDKRRHWSSLLLATYYNYHGPDFYYTLLSANFAGWGDKETFGLALRALNEAFHMVKPGIATAFQTSNTKINLFHGIGMVQAHPENSTDHNALFLHCNIIKWSMRDFFCDGCRDTWAPADARFLGIPPKWKGRFESPEDDIYENLHSNMRILNQAIFEKDGLDPEPLLWKALEHSACRSEAWGSEQVCGHVRRYMRRTFGFRFFDPNPSSTDTNSTGQSLDTWDRATSPSLCVGHPVGWYYFDAARRGW